MYRINKPDALEQDNMLSLPRYAIGHSCHGQILIETATYDYQFSGMAGKDG